VYRSTNAIATKLTNVKGNEATKYIQYDIMAYWDESAASKGLGVPYDGENIGEGDLKCEKYYGNTCHQIYFKPQGELRDQCYLVYDKAWVEKELKPNTWYTMSSPLQYIYAGDMYVPMSDGRQTTKAFEGITFDATKYSRSKYPVYQRAWMKSDVKQISTDKDYDASHYPAEAKTGDVDLNMGYWSHIYNKVDESYAGNATFGAYSIKAGNSLLPKDQSKNALLRLPKEDVSYQYYDYQGSASSSKEASVTKENVGTVVSSNKNSEGHGKMLVAYNNEEKASAAMTQSLENNESDFYLVANPYTCSISLKKFFEQNNELQKAAWLVEAGVVKPITSADFGKNDWAIQPTQAFFVKKNEGSTVDEVKFTAQMYVDRTITAGLQMASDYEKKITVEVANAKKQRSMARIDVRAASSVEYESDEDVEMLYDENLKEIPQVYTVAGEQAVAVNVVPEIAWMPLGIVSGSKEVVSLTMSGLRKLQTPVYLYDASTAEYTELQEGEAINVMAGDHGRYFLTQTRGTVTGIDRINAEESNNLIKVYSPAAGMIVVTALNGETLGKVEVYTLDGKLVHSYQLPDKQRMILRVPTGIFIVKASLSSDGKPCSKKIAVR